MIVDLDYIRVHVMKTETLIMYVTNYMDSRHTSHPDDHLHDLTR